jgi:hypothetical protein
LTTENSESLVKNVNQGRADENVCNPVLNHG